MTVTCPHTLLWSKFLKQEFYLKKSIKMRVFSFSINCFELTSIAIINTIICIGKIPCGLFYKQMLGFQHIYFQIQNDNAISQTFASQNRNWLLSKSQSALKCFKNTLVTHRCPVQIFKIDHPMDNYCKLLRNNLVLRIFGQNRLYGILRGMQLNVCIFFLRQFLRYIIASESGPSYFEQV